MVGFFRKLLDKGAKLALAGSLAGCVASTSIDMGKEYPELTPERKAAIEYRMLDGIERNAKVVWSKSPESDHYLIDQEPTIGFENDMHEFVYHAFKMMEDDQKKEGVNVPSINNVNLRIVPWEEMQEVCGEQAGACNNSNNTIYMPNDNDVIGFLTTLGHEVGHTNYKGNKEFVSESSEMYSPIKIYMFSRPIGSLMLPHMFGEIPKDLNLEEKSPFNKMYLKGRMYAIHNLNYYNGNIERALNHVAHSRTIVTETELQHYMEKLSGPTLADKDFQAWNQLIDNYLLIPNLTKDGHLTIDEASELAHYLRILNYRYSVYNVTNQQKVMDDINTLNYWYLISPYAKNPNFIGEATGYLRDRLYENIARMNGDMEANKHYIFNYAKMILDFNSKYPCFEKDPYKCPWTVREIKQNHVYSYEKLISSAMAIEQPKYMGIACDYVKEYIQKFYPETAFDSADFEQIKTAQKKETNNVLAFIANMAGNYQFVSLNYNEAKKFYQAASATTCMQDGWGDYNYCIYAQQNANFMILLIDSLNGI